MRYLQSFRLPGDSDEGQYLMSQPFELSAPCFDTCNAYPFKIFPQKGLSRIEFSDITILYGGNGSGKSTLLNLIAEKCGILRTVPMNRAPCFDAYLALCRYERIKPIPPESAIVSSDGVFDFLLDVRAINSGADLSRKELFEEYLQKRKELSGHGYRLETLADYEKLKEANEIRRGGMGSYTAARTVQNLPSKSNGESAYLYFTQKIGENALYLLDEPENSLSPKLQMELLQFLFDSVRFYRCQLIISTHSPFLLSLPGARIYDLDSRPCEVKSWTELENVRIYADFFKAHENEFR